MSETEEAPRSVSETRAPLTLRQAELLEHLRASIAATGKSPTVVGLMAESGRRGASGLVRMLQILTRKGYVRRRPDAGRRLELLGRGGEVLGPLAPPTLKPRDERLLAFLRAWPTLERGPTRAELLAADLGVTSKMSLTRAIERLEREGLVVRSPRVRGGLRAMAAAGEARTV